MRRRTLAVCAAALAVLLGCAGTAAAAPVAHPAPAAAAAPHSKPAANPPFGAQTRIALYAPVPAGWAVISRNYANQDKLIEYLGGAPFGARVAVLANQGLPAGWVLVGGLLDGQTAVVSYLGGAPHGTTVIAYVEILMPGGRIIGYPVPAGWRIQSTVTRSDGTYRVLLFP
ncbi:hypothetical protein ACFVXG_31795 [Kitasatospora sp. NPDC058162]|uniref:hypothetical protein n=1 Tax=Kitasatospora sp. NPDC058162 TaxID=3346362 RepID=UPI0036DDA594